MGKSQDRPSQISSAKIGLSQINAYLRLLYFVVSCEVCPLEISSLKINTPQIDLLLRLISPGVPSLHSLLEDSNMVWIHNFSSSFRGAILFSHKLLTSLFPEEEEKNGSAWVEIRPRSEKLCTRFVTNRLIRPRFLAQSLWIPR